MFHCMSAELRGDKLLQGLNRSTLECYAKTLKLEKIKMDEPMMHRKAIPRA